MLKRRLLLLAPFLALVSVALWVSRGEAEPGTVKEIVPGVWFREGEIKELGHCNNVIIEMKDYLIVIDANFPSGAELAMAAAKKVSSKPVKLCLRHPSPRRPRLRQPGVDQSRRHDAGLRRRRRRNAALRACRLARVPPKNARTSRP